MAAEPNAVAFSCRSLLHSCSPELAMAKHALCVGINDYPGTNSDLKGCVNDANDWVAVLKQRGYQDVEVLLGAQAPRAGMVDALQRLIAKGKDGDTLVFTYSGHGSWLPD